jgi:hypothetical protein
MRTHINTNFFATEPTTTPLPPSIEPILYSVAKPYLARKRRLDFQLKGLPAWETVCKPVDDVGRAPCGALAWQPPTLTNGDTAIQTQAKKCDTRTLVWQLFKQRYINILVRTEDVNPYLNWFAMWTLVASLPLTLCSWFQELQLGFTESGRRVSALETFS